MTLTSLKMADEQPLEGEESQQDATPHSLGPSLARSFRGHRGPINTVSFRPDLSQLATGGDDHTVMIWNFQPNMRAFRYLGHTVRALARNAREAHGLAP